MGQFFYYEVIKFVINNISTYTPKYIISTTEKSKVNFLIITEKT